MSAWGKPSSGPTASVPAVATPVSVAGSTPKPSFAELMKADQTKSDEAYAAELQRQFELEALGVVEATPIPEEEMSTTTTTTTTPSVQANAAGKAKATVVATEPEEMSDHDLAVLLQAQFNEEHDTYITEREVRANKGGGKVSVSLDLLRSPYPATFSSTTQYNQEPEAGASDDDYGDEDYDMVYDPSVKELRSRDGQIVTKHNAHLEAARNQDRIQDSFPLSFPTGDVKGRKVRVSAKVYNKMKTDAIKSDKIRNRVKEQKDASTSDLALDPKTRLVLFRLVDSGVLEEVNGAISTGKEAVVFHGTRKLDPEDPESATEEVAIKVFKTMLTEFKQRQQFLHGDRRFEDRVGRQSARKLVKLWAEKESANLIRMDRGGMHCPKVVTQNKHVLAMTFLGKDGVPAQKLKNVELSIKGFDRLFEDVKNAMHAMYHTCRLVHADLSEYNILYHNKKPYFIDVGQAVEPTHPRADAYLLRDCVQICRFFKSAGVTNPMEPRDLFSATCGKSLTAVEAVELQQTVISSRAAYSRRGKGDQGDLSDVCTKMNLNSMSLKPDAEEEEEEEDLKEDSTSSSNESGDTGFVMVENDNSPKEEESAGAPAADSKFVLVNHEEATSSDEQVSREE